jgi:FAD synthase
MHLDQEKILKAEEHHVIKTKDFNVYGKLRTEKPFVKSTQKSNIASDLNEKFITTESITDRRVKISSMANRQYINAPSVEEVRKQGQHQMILQAINKK